MQDEARAGITVRCELNPYVISVLMNADDFNERSASRALLIQRGEETVDPIRITEARFVVHADLDVHESCQVLASAQTQDTVILLSIPTSQWERSLLRGLPGQRQA